jgi:hypothetical protein
VRYRAVHIHGHKKYSGGFKVEEGRSERHRFALRVVGAVWEARRVAEGARLVGGEDRAGREAGVPAAAAVVRVPVERKDG